MTRHFAQHRSFYRPMLTGSCAFAMTRTLNALFGSLNLRAVREWDGRLDQDTAQDLAAFIAGGVGTIVNEWVVDGDDPLDPEELADRLLRLASAFAGGRRVRADGGHVR
jgi:hypothetical protein